MTRVLSVITAAYAPIADHFIDTSLSVAGQQAPAGWELEWIVQEDGESPRLRGIVDAVPIARYAANNARLGIAVTRNLALSRARGEVVQILDHDDVLLPLALAQMAAHFDDDTIHWAIGQADDLHPDRSRHKYTSTLPFGRIRAGVPGTWAIANSGQWPIHCAGLLMRVDALRVVGGWAGLAVDDDVAMFSAISECGDGINDPRTTWLYRKHQRQTHRSAAWLARGSEGRHVALQRIKAIRQMRETSGADRARQVSLHDADVGIPRQRGRRL